MRRSHVLLTLCSTTMLLMVGAACQVGSDCDFGLCDGPPFGSSRNDGGAEGSTDAASDVVQPPPGCDPKAEPKDSPKCVDDGYGVFVSKGGGPTAAGTKAAPLSAIAAAVALAANKGLPRVYVCGPDAFDETVTINAQVSIYGGFSCADWAPSADRPKLAPAKLGSLPLTLAGAPKDNIVLSDFDVTAPDGDPQANRSSIAIFVNQLAGAGATFRRLNVAAGLGRPGDDGQDGATMTFTSDPGTDAGAPTTRGNDAVGFNGGAAQTCTCSDGKTTSGGKGSNFNAAMGVAGLPALGGGAGGSTNNPCTNGGQGTDATAVGAAAPGATNLGLLDGTGWKPSAGEGGANGGHGQGGGGGGGFSINPNEGGGGSGACGGCGGTGGGGGKGGGASIAIAVLDSPTLSFTGLTLSSKDAGKGGDGKAGGLGAPGGARGNGAGNACPGGGGGKGADGAAGGGGAGGVSGGVVYKGPKPTGDFAWTGPSTKAARGESPGNPGIEGESAKELEIK